MKLGEDNGWLMLGFEPIAEFTENTGTEFDQSCISDPKLCVDGLTLGLWLKLGLSDKIVRLNPMSSI